MNDLTFHHEAELLELALWGLQAQSKESAIEMWQFEPLIMLATDVARELRRIEKEELAELMAERKAPEPEAPHTPLSVVK